MIALLEDTSTQLTITENERLAQLEAVIATGLQTFVEVGQALLEIRDTKLYKKEFSAFEEYCQKRWGMKRDYANKLIAASTVIENLDTIVSILPTTESQARPLTTLAPELQPIAWQQAVDTAPNGKITAAHVAAVVLEVVAASVAAAIVETNKPQTTSQPKSSHSQYTLAWSQSESERRDAVLSGETVLANMREDTALIEWAKANDLFMRIDRATEWGNPFEVDKDGDREEVILKYEDYYFMKPSLWQKLPTLRGKVLGCWCYPEYCHGHVLLNFMKFDHTNPWETLGFGYPIGKAEDYQRYLKMQESWAPLRYLENQP